MLGRLLGRRCGGAGRARRAGARCERGCDRGRVVLRGPDDDRRAGARERDAGACPAPGSSRSSPSSGASSTRYGSCSLSWKAAASSVGVAGGDRRAEQRRLRARRGGVGVRDGRRAGAPREASVFTRVSGTTTIGASGRSVASRARVRQRRCRCARSGRRRRRPRARGCRRAPRAAGRARAPRRARRSRPATASPATSPAAIVAADEPSPRSSGIRLTKRKRRPFDRRDERERPQRQVLGAPRQLVGALALERDRARRRRRASPRARSRGRAPRRRSRSPGRGWPSWPARDDDPVIAHRLPRRQQPCGPSGPCSLPTVRIDGEYGATVAPPPRGSTRRSVDDGRRLGEHVDRGRVLQAVAGEHGDDGAARLELDVREPRVAGGRRRLAEEALRGSRSRATRR